MQYNTLITTTLLPFSFYFSGHTELILPRLYTTENIGGYILFTQGILKVGNSSMLYDRKNNNNMYPKFLDTLFIPTTFCNQHLRYKLIAYLPKYTYKRKRSEQLYLESRVRGGSYNLYFVQCYIIYTLLNFKYLKKICKHIIRVLCIELCTFYYVIS